MDASHTQQAVKPVECVSLFFPLINQGDKATSHPDNFDHKTDRKMFLYFFLFIVNILLFIIFTFYLERFTAIADTCH